MNFKNITVSIDPYQILFPDSKITIESDVALHPEYVHGDISIRGLEGRFKLSNKNKTVTWLPQKTLNPGFHTLYLNGPVTQEGKSMDVKLEIPFFVVSSRSKIPSNLKAENIVRLKFDGLSTKRLPINTQPKGKYIEVLKACDKRTGKPVELAFDQSGRKVNVDSLFKKLSKEQLRKYGKLHPTLHKAFDNNNSAQYVAVWLEADDPEQNIDRLKLKPYEIPREVEQSVERIKSITSSYLNKLKERFAPKKLNIDPSAPVVYALLDKKQCLEISKEKQVKGLFLRESGGITDLKDSLDIANSDLVHALGYTGTGIRVAVWEEGPDVTTNLDIEAFYDPGQSNTSDHARHTHGIIKNTQRGLPNGHAKDCDLYSANEMDLDALYWAARTRSCTVISQSFHRSSEPKSSGLSYDDIYKDWLALHWPYPTILQAAGNFWNGDPDNVNPPEDEYVNHKGYNSLAVGNHNDTATGMSATSVYRNPASSHGDRELPEICANGVSVTTVGLTKSGTSMAAPAVAGCTALIQQVNSQLVHWPEGCRAILLAGANKNVVGSTWWKDIVSNVDAADGSGAVDALESVRIAKTRRTRNSSGTRRGWDIGKLTSADFDSRRMSKFSYSVTIPPYFLGSITVKVVLAWTSRITSFFGLPINSVLTTDFDLMIFDSNNNQVGYSGSWDNSYEIAEFAARSGETYTIKIRRWSGTDDTWYGIAWTQRGGLRLFPFTELSAERLWDE